NRSHRSADSGIAKKCSAARKNLFVRGLHVSMGAEDGGNFAIEKTGERNFFARRFAVNINHDDRSFRPHFRNRHLYRVKWVLQNREHESTALDIDHAYFSFRGFQDDGAVPRRADRKSTRLNSSHVAISYAVFCLK